MLVKIDDLNMKARRAQRKGVIDQEVVASVTVMDGEVQVTLAEFADDEFAIVDIPLEVLRAAIAMAETQLNA